MLDRLIGYYGTDAYCKRTRRIATRNGPLHSTAETTMNDYRDGRQYGVDTPPLWLLWGLFTLLLSGCAALATFGDNPASVGWAVTLGLGSVPSLVIASGYPLTTTVPTGLAEEATEVSEALRRLAKLDRRLARQGRTALVELLTCLERPNMFGGIENQWEVRADIVALGATVAAHLERAELAAAHANVPLAQRHLELAADRQDRAERARAERYQAGRSKAAAFNAESENLRSDIDWYHQHGDSAPRELSAG